LKLFRLCQKGLFPVFGDVLENEKPLLALADLRRALLLASAHGRAGEIYLINSGVDHRLGEILAAAGDLVGQPKPYIKIPLVLARGAALTTPHLFRLLGKRPPLTKDRLALFLARRRTDIAKARRELQYRPQVQDPIEILRPAYEGFRDSGQL